MLTATCPLVNFYHIIDYCPILSNVMPIGEGQQPYFNRTDVKKVIHAPLDVDWTTFSAKNVFIHAADYSDNAIQDVLPQVIEATNRVLIGGVFVPHMAPENWHCA